MSNPSSSAIPDVSAVRGLAHLRSPADGGGACGWVVAAYRIPPQDERLPQAGLNAEVVTSLEYSLYYANR